jgi:phenylacetate-CoA ligase
MSLSLRRGLLRLHEFSTGRHILERLDELNRTQWLGRDELMALQRAKLLHLVEYAYQYVPYYRHTFDKVGFRPSDLRHAPDSFRCIPLLTKAIVRENLEDLLTTEPQRRKQLTKVTTSGSTGHPLVFWQDHDFRDSVTADIQRHIEWAGAKMGQLHAYIWGANFEADSAQALRTRLIDWEWNRFLTNAFLLTNESLAAFADRVQRQHPRVLYGYASSLYRFAQFARQSPQLDITSDGIISSAEVLLPAVRQFIEETFHCRVFDRYGTKELGGVACECEGHTGLHISAENNFVEVVHDGRPTRGEEVGAIVVTNLNNKGMPFIRYSIEDDGAWHEESDCSCGRSSPRLKTLEGRLVDTFKTCDGRTAWSGFAGAGYSCLANPAIKQFQIVQKSLDHMVVRLVRAGDVPQANLDELVRTIHTAFGDNVEVEFEFPEEIPVLPSGKHRYAISELSCSDK